MSFVCQQCKQPLELDASLVDLTPSAYDVIASSLPQKSYTHRISDAEKLAQIPAPEAVKTAWKQAVQINSTLSPKALGKQPQKSIQPAESYVFLQDSVVQKIPSSPPTPSRTKRLSATKKKEAEAAKIAKVSPLSHAASEAAHPSPTPLSHHLRSTVKLFSLLSNKTELDYPLCAECTHILLSSLSRQLEETKRERDGYIAYDKERKKEREREDEQASKEEIEAQIEKLKFEERVAIEELREAQREKERLDEEMNALDLEEKELEEEEAE